MDPYAIKLSIIENGFFLGFVHGVEFLSSFNKSVYVSV